MQQNDATRTKLTANFLHPGMFLASARGPDKMLGDLFTDELLRDEAHHGFKNIAGRPTAFERVASTASRCRLCLKQLSLIWFHQTLPHLPDPSRSHLERRDHTRPY